MRAPWTTLALAMVLACSAGANEPPSGREGIAGNDLEVSFGFERWGQMRANPRRAADAVRQTRVFPLVLEPRQFFFAPQEAHVALLPRTHHWEYRGRDERGPTVITRTADERALWMRWDLFKLPRQAQVERAELRLTMQRRDLEEAWKAPPRVTLALQAPTPAFVTADWNRALTPQVSEVTHNYPTMWWDVTRFVAVAQQTGELHRNLGLVIGNAGRMEHRRPELHVWYRIPVVATAE